jgi:hypothetical protein
MLWLISALGSVALLSGCAGGVAQSADPAPATKESQWKELTAAKKTKNMIGNTIVEDDGKWAAYYDEGGRKVVWVNGRESAERKWWIDDQKQWCETMYRPKAARCTSDSDTEIELSGASVRKIRSYGGFDWTAKIVAGNLKKRLRRTEHCWCLVRIAACG